METKSKIIIGSFIGAFTLAFFLIGGLGLLESGLFIDNSDNTLTYSNENLTVTIKDEIGTTLGEVTLKSHISIDEVLTVPYNQEVVVMYYDFIGWDIYEDGLGKVYFIDMKTGKEIVRDYYFVKWTSELIEVNDYIEICDILNVTTNTTYDCRDVLSGSHLEEKWSWERLEKTDIPSKVVRIGLKTYVERGDHIDVIWTIAGLPIEKHAEYEAGESNTRTTTVSAQYTLADQATSFRGGIKITVGYEHVFLTKVTATLNTIATEAYIIDPSDGSVLADSTMTNDNATFNYMLEGNTSYYILVGNPDALWTVTRKDSLSFPIDMTEVSFVKGAQGTGHPYSEDAARAWSIQSLDLAEAILIEPGLILNITGNFNYSNGTAVNNADVVAFWVGNNSVAKNTTSDASGDWQLVQMPNATYIVVGYDPSNSSINADVQAHVVVGT